MEIILAEQAGFCYGVKRAVDLAEQAGTHSGFTYTLGPIIHNPQVVDRLLKRGIKKVDDLDEIQEGTVIFRSHGVGPQIIEDAHTRQLTVVDATCPFVKRAQMDAKMLHDAGYSVIIVGEKDHPEVQSIVAWADGDAVVVASLNEAQALPPMLKTGIVAQTTLAARDFTAIVEAIQAKSAEVKVCDTICNATHDRLSAAESLAKHVDVMIVVGGKHSANTTRLARLCSETGTLTYHVEIAKELKPAWFKNVRRVGITAGASTPDWIIEEVFQTMQDIDFSKMFEESLKGIDRGAIVTGTVVQVGRDEVFVDIGYKSEGIIPRNELSVDSNLQPEDIVKVGDEIEVYIIKQEGKDGYPLLSKKRADARKGWEKIEELAKANTIISVTVIEVVKGGLVVNINGLRGFIPASQIERRFVADLSVYVGQELRVRILELDRSKNKIVLSQKVVLEAEANISKEQTMSDIVEGQVRQGVVRRLTDYGAFVDIGGIEGLLHVSEMSWARVKDPAMIVSVGDEIPVKVLKLDKEANRISLGLKQMQPDPWVEVINKYQVGQIYQGKIVRLAKFGAFVALEPGIDGLIHISHLANRRVLQPEEVVTVGQDVKVKVIDINPAEHRIGLSIREAEQEQEKAQYRAYIDQQEDTDGMVGDTSAELGEGQG